MLYVVVMTAVAVTGLFTVHRGGLGHFVTFDDVSRTNCVVLTMLTKAPRNVTSLMCCVMMCVTTGLTMFNIVGAVRRRARNGVRHRSCGKLCGAGPGLAVIVALTLFSLTNVPPFTKFFDGFFMFVTTFRDKCCLVMFVTLIGAVVSLCCCLLVMGTVFVAPGRSPVNGFHATAPVHVDLLMYMTNVFILKVVDKMCRLLDSATVLWGFDCGGGGGG